MKKHVINFKTNEIKNSIIQCFIIGRVYLSLGNNITNEVILSVVRLFFDILHGIDRSNIPLIVALEFAILLGFDGQLKLGIWLIVRHGNQFNIFSLFDLQTVVCVSKNPNSKVDQFCTSLNLNSIL